MKRGAAPVWRDPVQGTSGLSVQRFRSIGLIPAATDLAPSLKFGWASRWGAILPAACFRVPWMMVGRPRRPVDGNGRPPGVVGGRAVR